MYLYFYYPFRERNHLAFAAKSTFYEQNTISPTVQLIRRRKKKIIRRVIYIVDATRR